MVAWASCTRPSKSRSGGALRSRFCRSPAYGRSASGAISTGGAGRAALQHSNIIPVYGLFHEGDYHFYTMQYVDGVGLDAVIAALRRQRSHTDVQRRESERYGSLARTIAATVVEDGYRPRPPISNFGGV